MAAWLRACTNMNMLCCIAPCKCRPNAPQNRRVDTRLLSWQAVSCWRCCEPPLARTRHPANGVTGLSLAWWNSGRCTSWSSDGCCSTAGGESGSRDAAEAGKSSMKQHAHNLCRTRWHSAGAACVAVFAVLQRPKSCWFGDSLAFLATLSPPCSSSYPCIGLPPVWETDAPPRLRILMLHAMLSVPPRPDLNYRSTLPLRRFDLICSDPTFRILRGSSSHSLVL
ncbi:hypothetical protein M440DRAFT_1013711 [Trichoderma longibrachiatum ATCC 18648]|uniref:Uncharacterized protein n=1 Tax=Trichoderma longibrachiatum ATCC 18648 TaxID=983965 RepID=A0A2T4CIE9_TRILO|nr:hypothetical protein M440DRAFT_1013711 [Trichoderma longibrachiatum ATCC 18648]